jgi:hypothetical protein
MQLNLMFVVIVGASSSCSCHQFCRTVIKLAGFLEGQALLRSGAADVLLQPAVITGNNMGQYGFTRPVASSW